MMSLTYTWVIFAVTEEVFSSPESKAPGKFIVWEASVRRPSTLSNDFSSETTGPNVTKFHM